MPASPQGSCSTAARPTPMDLLENFRWQERHEYSCVFTRVNTQRRAHAPPLAPLHKQLGARRHRVLSCVARHDPPFATCRSLEAVCPLASTTYTYLSSTIRCTN